MLCNTLQHSTILGGTLQHTATHCNTLQHTATHCNTLQHAATHNNTLQYSAARCPSNESRLNTLQHAATRCNTLQHNATRCNTLQHAATRFSSEETGRHVTKCLCVAACCSVLQRVAVCCHVTKSLTHLETKCIFKKKSCIFFWLLFLMTPCLETVSWVLNTS